MSMLDDEMDKPWSRTSTRDQVFGARHEERATPLPCGCCPVRSNLIAIFAVFSQSLRLPLEKSILTPLWNVPTEIRSFLHEFVYHI